MSVDEIFLEVKPGALADLERRTSQSSATASGHNNADEPETMGLGDTSMTDNITDNIQYIAGSIEKVLQELQLEVSLFGLSSSFPVCPGLQETAFQVEDQPHAG